MDALSFSALVAAVTILPLQQTASPDDRIYGRVETAGGDVYRGYIHWDRNEGSWSDILHGDKELPFENVRDARRAGLWDGPGDDRIEIFGLRISWDDEDEGYPDEVQSGIRFGHLRSLRVLDDDAALLVLRSGEEVELEGGSTDIGTGNRGITVIDPDRGTVELRWRDLDRIDFDSAPADAPGGREEGRRLYGTVETRRAGVYTGYVAWDTDEVFTTDVLDGEERGRDREIPFGLIAAIEPDGRSGARVVLRDGEEIRLSGSNDVNSSNRGIAVSDPALGQVTVDWDELVGVRFSGAPEPVGRDAFDGGAALYGTVVNEDGRSWTGWVRWDNDEAYSWELLNGDYRGVEMEIELSKVAAIRRRSSRSAEVFLRDGRVMELEGSNDVNSRNKGVFVTTDDGERVAVAWRDLDELRLHWD